MRIRPMYVLFVAAIILVATAVPLNSATPCARQAQAIPRTALATTTPPQTEWNKTYGGKAVEEAYSVDQTSDGGFILAGYTHPPGTYVSDFWLVKTDSSGNQQWNGTYAGRPYDGGPCDDRAWSVRQTSDGGYIAAGYTNNRGPSYYDIWLVKTDSSGKEQWNRTYGGTEWDEARSVQRTSDGGYVVAGLCNSRGWLMKTDSLGNQLWNKTYGIGDSEFSSVQQTPDGGYVMAGFTNATGGSYVVSNFWLVRTDSSGDTLWNKTFRGNGEIWAQSVEQTFDGGYVVAATTNAFGAGSYDFWLVKTDSSGNWLWNKTYGATGDDELYCGKQTADGGYIMAGYTDSFGAGNTDMWLVKTDSIGNQLWNKTYGGSGYDYAYSLQVTPNGGFIAAGATNSFGAGYHDFWLVKTGDATPPSTVIDLTAGSSTSDSIVLTWTAPGDNWMKGNATGYIVEYSTTGYITADNWSSATIYEQSWTPARNGTTETHMVSGLTSATKYWFAIEAYDRAPNYGGVSNSPNATTGTTTPLIIIAAGVAVAAVVIVLVALVLMKRRKPS